MKAKQVTQWIFIFTLLSSATAWVLTPHSNADTLLAYAGEKRHAVVLPIEVQQENIWRRIISRLVRKDLICPISSEQYQELDEKFSLDTEVIEVNGDDITLVKVPKNEAKLGAIRKFLREENKHLKCTVLPSRSWYYLVFTGTVS